MLAGFNDSQLFIIIIIIITHADESRGSKAFIRSVCVSVCLSALEMCMGMGSTGIQWVSWDSRGNESDGECVIGMGITLLEWEGFPTVILFSTKIRIM